MDEKKFEILIKNMEIIIKLLGANMIKDKDYRDQVMLLHNVGLDIQSIAALTGKTKNNVNVTLHLIKKGKKTEKRMVKLHFFSSYQK
jgi:hypothetical protein